MKQTDCKVEKKGKQIWNNLKTEFIGIVENDVCKKRNR